MWFCCVHPVDVLAACFKVGRGKGDSHTESGPHNKASSARQRGALENAYDSLGVTEQIEDGLKDGCATDLVLCSLIRIKTKVSSKVNKMH